MQKILASTLSIFFLVLLMSGGAVANDESGMTRLADSDLSEVSGRQGIDIEIQIDTEAELAIEDTDGLGSPGQTFAPDGAFIYVPTIALEGQIFVSMDLAVLPGDEKRIDVRVDIPEEIVVGEMELHVFGSGLSRSTPNYNRLIDDQDNAFARLQEATANIEERGPVITIGEIRVSPISLSLELNTDAGNLIHITQAEVFQVSIGRMVIHDRSKSGGGGIGTDETLLTGIDLTGTRIFLEGESLVIETNMSNGAAAITGLGLTNAVGETQNYFGNGMLRNIDVRGTRISIGTP